LNRPETIIFLLIAIYQLFTLESMGQVTGTVRDADQQPLPHVHIINKRAELGTQTDGHGRYSISADSGDTLQFTFVGMQTVELGVEISPSVINISMQELEVELEEVEIKAEYIGAHKTQKELLAEYPENKKLIKTSLGILDRDLSSTAFRIIDGDDMVPGGRDFLFSLQVHVPQMKVIRDCAKCPQCDCVYLRNFTGLPTTALFDVDGIVSSSTPTYLTASDIDRIAILERNAAFIRYGPQGAAGVIVINTRARTELDDMGVIRSYDNRALADSLKRSVSYLEPYRPLVPSYIKEMKAAKTKKKAWSIYESQKESYISDPYYFLEVYDYFLARWGNSKESRELFQDVRNHLPDNVPELKVLAYLQQKYGNFEGASDLYIQILMMQSWDAQALRDVANAFVEAEDIKKAWMYYTQYIDIQNQLTDARFDAYGADLLITTEMMDILDRNKEPFLDRHNLDSILDDNMRTRLVFEWNNQDTEFELQFVTPEGYYDTWEYQPGRGAIQDPEMAKGYCSKQFFLGKENLGLWQVNIDYKGNSSELPSYLKVSVYRNYGLADQNLEVRVYKLSEENEKVQLLTLEQN